MPDTRYFFSCLFKIRHFGGSQDRGPDIRPTRRPRGGETKDGHDGVRVPHGERTEQTEINAEHDLSAT